MLLSWLDQGNQKSNAYSFHVTRDRGFAVLDAFNDGEIMIFHHFGGFRVRRNWGLTGGTEFTRLRSRRTWYVREVAVVKLCLVSIFFAH